MAVEIGTASGHKDLLAKLRTFALAQGWTENRYDIDVGSSGEHELLLQGPGIGGTDSIYVGIRTYEDAGQDYFNWAMRGFIGFIPGDGFALQPGASPEYAMPLWNQSIPYWLVVNGDRIALMAQVSTVWTGCYLGFLYRYATPQQFPYPLYIGAALDQASATRWSEAISNHKTHVKGVNHALRYIEGTWDTGLNVWPYSTLGNLRESFGGDYALFPLILSDTTPNVYGELQGLFHISGFAQAAGNTTTIDTIDYIVAQDIFRTGNNDYWALRLE